MTNSEIKKVLLSKGVQNLYHTNTVETSLSFMKSGGMLSRGLCEDMGFPQTDQNTDALDKEFGIYYDIFFDSIEIQRITGISYYGPVMFVYSLDVLDIVEEGNILITKSNPQKWKHTESYNDHYFLRLDELNVSFLKNDFGQHITLVNQRQPLLFKYLERIVLSDAQQSDNTLFYTAKNAIAKAIESNQLNVCLEIRDYGYSERFYNTYSSSNKELIKKHFGLGGHTL